MANYKLSYTAKEIDEKLKMIEEGGVGYIETGLDVELVPEARYEFNAGAFIQPVAKMYNAGAVIVTKIDGVKYSAVSQGFANPETGDPIIFVGNGVLFGFPDTGEPYVTAIVEENGILALAVGILAEVDSESLEHELSVVVSEGKVHTIDQKYLPDTVATKSDIFGAMEASY